MLVGPAGEHNIVYVVANGSHCSDLSAPSPRDSPAIMEAHRLHEAANRMFIARNLTQSKVESE